MFNRIAALVTRHRRLIVVLAIIAFAVSGGLSAFGGVLLTARLRTRSRTGPRRPRLSA